MRRISILIVLMLAGAFAAPAAAQSHESGTGGRPSARRGAAANPPPAPAADASDEDADEAPTAPQQLRAPTFEPPNVTRAPAEAEDSGDETPTPDAAPDHAAAPSAHETAEHAPAQAATHEGAEHSETLLGNDEHAHSADDHTNPESGSQSDPTAPNQWVAPSSVLSLHGYLRTRGEFQDTFFLGRIYQNGNDMPFDMFHPSDSRTGTTVDGGCGSTPGTGICGGHTLSYATMRMRLEPQVNISDDIRIKMQLDMFDNMVLGSATDAAFASSGGGYARSPFAPLTPFVTSGIPPQYALNSFNDSIIARRAWAEVRNRMLGELRFGRMGYHWGLGMVANGGDGLDSDYQTNVDRVMVITKQLGLYFMAAYDFSFSGIGANPSNTSHSVVDTSTAYDPAQNDNVHQLFFAIAHRSSPEEQEAALLRGDFVLNVGSFFAYRSLLLQQVANTTSGMGSTMGATDVPTTFVRRNATTYTPDLWAQLLWKSLRIEVEAALVLGSIENIQNTYVPQNLPIRQFGAVLESEYRLFDDKFAVRFNAGYASGDSDAEGLGAFADTLSRQSGRNTAISTFSFHPNYRIDLILWRTILRQVSGAYFFRPGVSYDFIRSPFGQLLGGRIDAVYSRASSPVQTWGNSANLGVELDGSLYYRTEDGPDFLDGFHAVLQYGVLFPMQGLGYLSQSNGSPEIAGGNPTLHLAQTVRLILGVVF